MGNLKNMIPGIGLVAGAFAGVTAAISKSVKTMREWEDAWAKTEQSAAKLDIAGKLNANLKGTSTELKKFASDLSSQLKNTISGGDIMEAMSSVAFDKSADQVKKLTSAAAELSKAMGTDLNTAMSQLNGTFSGSAGALSKMFPELKKLSKEELEAGKAIDVVKEKLNGVADALAETTSGSLQRYKNATGDLKEELGALVTGYFTPLRNWLSSIKEGWADALKSKREYNEYSKKMQSGQQDAETLEGYIDSATKRKQALEAERLADQNDVVSAGANYDYYTQQINQLVEEIAEAERKLVWERNAQVVAEAKARREALEEEKRIQKEKLKLEQEKLEQERKEALERKNQDFVKVIQAENEKAKVEAEIAEIEKQIKEEKIKEAEGVKKILMLQDKNYAEASKIDSSWAKASVEAATTYMLNAEKEMTDKIIAERKELAEKEKKEREDYISSLRNSITGKAGDTGSLIETAISGDWMKLLFDTLGMIVQKLSDFSDIISNVLNFITTTVDNIIEPLANIINSVARPMMEGLNVLGDTLSVMLQAFEPLISAIAGPVMKSLMTVLITVLSGIYNSVVAIHNLFSSKKNDWAYMDLKETIANLWNGSGTGAVGPAGTSSAGIGNASYTAARDIYININYNNSYVNGDAMAIAIDLRDKIREAERMGY